MCLYWIVKYHKIKRKEVYFGKSLLRSRCFKKQDQWDTNCIFTEFAGFYTLETDQDKLTVRSGIIGGRIRSRTLIGNYLRENSILTIKLIICSCIYIFTSYNLNRDFCGLMVLASDWELGDHQAQSPNWEKSDPWICLK